MRGDLKPRRGDDCVPCNGIQIGRIISLPFKRWFYRFIILTGLLPCSTKSYNGVISMVFSIRLTEEERNLAESYAKLHSLSLSEAFKRTLFEKIEDEYDIAVAESAYKEYVDSGRKSTAVQDFWNELDEEA